MGRKVADATNAWRIRRTRGDTGLFLLFLTGAFRDELDFFPAFVDLCRGFLAPD
jgi:hypothetical protein